MQRSFSPTIAARRKARTRRLVRLALFAAVAYGAVAYGWPWARERLAAGGRRAEELDPESGNAQALACVAQSERALKDFRSKVSSLGSTDVELNWREAMRLTEVEIETARRECRCDAEACVVSADAMAALTAEKQTFEATVLRGGTPHDVVAHLAPIADRLAEARRLLRHGS